MRKGKIDRFNLIEIVIIFLSINYMVGTIILKDIAPVKYLRDILLVAVLLLGILHCKGEIRNKIFPFALLLPFAVIGTIKAPSISNGVVVLRRYLFPIGFLMAIMHNAKKYDINRVGRFVLYFFSALAIFGVFQAYVLGDTFLRQLGYPVVYSYGYKRDMLYNSFYFGGFGIQRVVATFSSSNICGLAFGMAILFVFFMYPCMRFGRKEKILFAGLILGYLLTVSRSNFLAMGIVTIMLLWPYIPAIVKKWIPIAAIVSLFAIVVVGVIQGESGIIYGLYKWVIASFSFTEDSAAGRSGIWQAAFNEVIKSPLGIGFGHVGGMADNLGVEDIRYSSENSYLAIALDMGWAAVLIYVSILVGYYRHFKRKADRQMKNTIQQRYYKLCSVLIIYVMIVMFFSNHIHDMEVIAILFFYIGIGFSGFDSLYIFQRGRNVKIEYNNACNNQRRIGCSVQKN